MLMLAISTIVFVAILLSMMYGQLLVRAGGGRAPGVMRGVGRGGEAKGGQPTRGIAYRSYEGDIAAVDTLTSLTAFGGNTVSTQVPKGASVLDSMDIGLSVDLGAAVVSVRAHVQVQLIGQGFKNSPHQFGGPAVSCQGVTSGLAIAGPTNVRYEGLNIECVEGGDASIQGVLIGEDPGDTTLCVTLGFLLD
jgi:hypothetical protein